ncbi:MAG TPA: alpha/beta hydrolase [Arthrobacter sp.]|nr:alpha/beta hydrolase [Arthrobacter sp.]
MTQTSSQTNSATTYRTVDVAVRGGSLHTAIWGPEDSPENRDTPTILAVHGVTASHKCWAYLAAALPDVRIIAPDLRGRGRSNSLPGPYGMASHAEDLAAVLAELAPGPVVVVGHSMGGFASVVLSDLFPERVRSLVLVDGGLPLQVPEGLSDAEIISSILGPAAERLNATFPSREVYRSFWRKHPAFSADWGPFVDDYVDYDLTGEAPELKPATRYEAMAEDTADLHRGSSLLKALADLSVPADVLRAPRGLQNEPAGLYAPGYLETWAEKLPVLHVRDVPDVNHYTIIMGERGAAAVAGSVRAALAAG